MRILLLDIRYAFNALVHRPGYTLLAVATLALGIGANTTIFSLANWVLLRPVPGVTDPGDLLTLRLTSQPSESGGYSTFSMSHPLFETMRRAEGAGGMAAYYDFEVQVALPEVMTPRRVHAQLVTESFFDVLGVRMLSGRGFIAGDDSPVASPSVVISERMWRRSFGAAANVVGTELMINGSSVAVVGVAPHGFLGPELPGDTDLWVPAGAHLIAMPQRGAGLLGNPREGVWFNVIARRSPTASVDVVQQQAAALAARQSRLVADGRARILATEGIGMLPSARQRAKETLRLMLFAVSLMLLLACSNIANLLLARATGRVEELGLLRALGAGRARLVSLLMTESVLLSAAGGAVGLVVSLWMVQLFQSAQVATFLPSLGEVELDARVLAYTLLLATFAGVASGVLPAVRFSRSNIGSALRARRDSGGSRMHDVLVVAQLAMALVLLIGAALLMSTIANLRGIEVGFDRQGLTVFAVDPASQGYGAPRVDEIYRRVVEEVTAIPGVTSVAAVWPPLMSRYRDGARIGPVGTDFADGGRTAARSMVSSGFFEKMGIPIVRGRGFGEWGLGTVPARGGSPVVLSESLARELFPESRAVGEQLALAAYRETPDGIIREAIVLDVIGVAGDTRVGDLTSEDRARLYEPIGVQRYCVGCFDGKIPGQLTFQVRTGGGSVSSLEPEIRRVVEALDPSLPAYNFATVSGLVDAAIANDLFVARLSGALALFAVMLAAVGTYGVVATGCRRRVREFGVRIALGASTSSVLRLVIGQSTRNAALGLGLGLVLLGPAHRVVESRLYGVEPFDPAIVLASAAILFLIVQAASLIPARRATRTDPLTALRSD